MKVLGVIRKTGNYQGIEYDNHIIHCTLTDGKSIAGEITETVKIKTDKLDECFGKAVTAQFWQELLGQDIAPFYDKYGHATFIQIRETVIKAVEMKKTG